MPKEELKSRMKSQLQSSPRLFSAMMSRLIEQKALEENGPLVCMPGHRVQFNTQEQQQVDRLLEQFRQEPFSPPSVKDSQTIVGEELFTAMIELGYLVAVSPDVVFRKEDYDRMVDDIRQLIGAQGTITAAEVRDHFNTSRKYVLALLEHLDAIGITVRTGDSRKLRK
jgi:selenocysteine-specific elongation factor